MVDQINRYSQLYKTLDRISKADEAEKEEERNTWVQALTTAVSSATAGTAAQVTALTSTIAPILQGLNPLVDRQAKLQTMAPPPLQMYPQHPEWHQQQGLQPQRAGDNLPPRALTYPGFEPGPIACHMATQQQQSMIPTAAHGAHAFHNQPGNSHTPENAQATEPRRTGETMPQGIFPSNASQTMSETMKL